MPACAIWSKRAIMLEPSSRRGSRITRRLTPHASRHRIQPFGQSEIGRPEKSTTRDNASAGVGAKDNNAGWPHASHAHLIQASMRRRFLSTTGICPENRFSKDEYASASAGAKCSRSVSRTGEASDISRSSLPRTVARTFACTDLLTTCTAYLSHNTGPGEMFRGTQGAKSVAQ